MIRARIFTKYFYFSFAIFSLFVLPQAKAQSPGLSNLTCEHLSDPLGIDAASPRLSWQMTDSSRGARQTAYQVWVGTDSLSLLSGHADAWHTSKIASDSMLVHYQGKPLAPFTRYYWKVMVWDEHGKTSSSRIAHFETGLMNKSNWQGFWISDDKDKNFKPAPYFRKVFSLHKKIRSARAYIAVAGLYELYINGHRIGDHRLDPMYTRFDRRNMYVTYDVTSELKDGDNALGVLLGNGWYNLQSTAVWHFDQAPWRNRPAFCMDLRITYDDGNVQTISTDKSWKTSTGPVIFNSIYTGEHYDARLEQLGWNTTHFNDSSWRTVIIRSAPSPNIVAQAMQPIRHVEAIPALSTTKKDDSTYLFDIGRNIAGVSKITVEGEAGTVLRLKYAERLDSNGYADQSNIDVHYRPTDDSDPFQTDIFILNGKGRESFTTRFNYKGFQYVQVTSSKPVKLSKESLTAYFMHSDVAPVGNIHSSNPTINKIWAATNHSYLSNFFGYPTDCPQREKNGWTGDAHIASETGLYNFDGITVYEKWMADHRDEQQPNGVLPSIIPSNGWGYEWGNGPDWTSTIAIIPWNLYLFYGDAQALADNYANIKRYVDHIDYLYPNGLTTWGLGDWVPVKSKSPVEFSSSIYYYADALILSKAAQLFHKPDDEKRYTALAEKIKNAINDKYLDRATGIYDKGYQTELSMPLFWGVVPEELRHKVAGNLAAAVQKNNNHLDVGILGAKAILSALSDNGYPEVAYALAAQETYPSWGWWIVNGATTLYENWKIDSKSDISLNHIMFGEIGAWLYKGIGGIRPDEKAPGFKHILLTPHFIKELRYFDADHEGPYGKIVSSWKRADGQIRYTVVIPPNSTATLHLDDLDGKKVYLGNEEMRNNGNIELTAGHYQFVIR